MKKFIALAALALASLGASAQSITIGVDQPGMFGSITIHDDEDVRVYNSNPVAVHSTRSRLAPLYIRAPREHRLNWATYCVHYNACYREVYFVSDTWYDQNRGHDYWERRGRHFDGHRDRHHPRHHRGHGRHDHGHDRHDRR